MRTRFKKVYYSVHALQDGTIVFASQTRKPVKSSVWGKPKIDIDGIHRWYLEREDNRQSLSDWAKAAQYAAIAQCLNTKRAIRDQVESRLAGIETQLKEIAQQLELITQSTAASEGKSKRSLI